MKLTASSLALLAIVSVEAQVIPQEYAAPGPAAAVNGSDDIGHCSHFNTAIVGSITCTDPPSSVLFDGHLPTLTGLDGGMWASQLLTLNPTATSRVDIDFELANSIAVEKVEVAMFNCPQWGIGVENVTVLVGAALTSTIKPVLVTSCESLVEVCIPISSNATHLTLYFFLPPDSDWVHLAEVTFNVSSRTCPPDMVITEPTSVTNDDNSSTIPVPVTTITPTTDTCPSCFPSVVLAAILSAIITALLVTVIFVLVLIAVCKCRSKFTRAGPERGISAAPYMVHVQEYEEMDVGEGACRVATSEPMYMEVGGASTFKLKENEAYALHTSYGT